MDWAWVEESLAAVVAERDALRELVRRAEIFVRAIVFPTEDERPFDAWLADARSVLAGEAAPPPGGTDSGGGRAASEGGEGA